MVICIHERDVATICSGVVDEVLYVHIDSWLGKVEI